MNEPISETAFTANGLILKPLEPDRAADTLDYYIRNAGHFSRFMPELPQSFYTVKCHIDALWRELDLMAEYRHIRFYIFDAVDLEYKHILGDVSISDIKRGAVQNAVMGFKTDCHHTNRGIMKRAVDGALKFAFKDLGLHRIESYAVKDNQYSIKVLKANHFSFEGIARELAFVQGKWKDHSRFSILEKEYISFESVSESI